jgi:hypothetical protein
MNNITFPLNQCMRGTAVADLQDILQQCLERGVLLAKDEPARRELFAALKLERTGQTYGGATTKLVGRFQEERRLQASCEVDEPTAGALNALLQELPDAIVEIERYMADLEFFRGLVFILLVLAGMLITKAYYAMATVSVLIAVFSLIRYFHKKRKATETAYKYVIYLENCPLPAEGVLRSKQSMIIDRQVSPLPVEYSDTVKFFTTGLKKPYIHWSAPQKSIWYSRYSLARQEMLYCLAGRGWLQHHNNTTGQNERFWLSPNATITIPVGRVLQIENPGNEPLALISSKI